MKKVGEHVTIDFLGVKREYTPEFYNKVIYKIEKKLVESTYNQENSKRFIIAMKQKLQA